MKKLNYPQIKGLCVKLFILLPKKPNSSLRKICRMNIIKLKIFLNVFIPGEGYCLKQYNYSLIWYKNKKDLIGINYIIIRGTLDSSGVKNRKKSRSKYGSSLFINKNK